MEIKYFKSMYIKINGNQIKKNQINVHICGKLLYICNAEILIASFFLKYPPLFDQDSYNWTGVSKGNYY